MNIVVGIPAYNEEKHIGSLILKLKKITDNVIVCNDGSSDMTGEIAEKMGAIVVNHPKNLGYGAGIRSIFLKAREIGADILVTFDADGQHRIEDIQSVIEPILKNQADMVIGSRFNESGIDNVPEYRKFGIKALTKLTNLSLDEKISDSQSGFRAYNKKILDEITPSEYGMGVSTEILIKANKHGFKITEVPITILYRGDTSTHNPVSHGASVFMSTIKFTSIEHPLKFYGIPGVLFLVIGLAFALWAIDEYTTSHDLITNITLIAVGSTIIGAMLTVTAIILYSMVNLVREQRH
ncbi:MAG: glycosyltransferase family 2 protein [Nitrososphaeria archaeon]|nr:glycosyltransferase family 2 protein [Nitrososphaeria archaeon]NDB63358.1 glycosyltransferase family 2 protein [Nitrosopumilaceae archaeon]NDB88938.1 glycosyltransferase family 2 protein [Nitrososphaerota archaeon]NDB47315.1 glycosyltransferase family 2 protein [Nitrososphaeria archaeon]NDB90798.1 glycosyltransferase family 2 protein [Nitrososphaerota archaeon]